MSNLSNFGDNRGTSKSVGYRISDPEAQDGLTPTIPRGEVPTEYINHYKTRKKVRCAFCDKHQLHNRGFTVRMEDGRIALCGRDCGILFFGEDVAKKLERILIRKEKKSIEEDLIAQAGKELPDFERELWRSWVLLEQAIGDVVILLPQIDGQNFRNNVNASGDLLLNEYEFFETTMAGAGKMIERAREIGRVRGASILRAGSGWFRQAAVFSRKIATGRYQGRDVPWAERVKLARELPDSLSEGLKYLALAERFFEPSNLQEYARAYEFYTHRRLEIRVVRGLLQVELDDGSKVEAPMPALGQRPVIPEMLRSGISLS